MSEGLEVWLNTGQTGTKYLEVRHQGQVLWVRFGNHPRNRNYRRVDIDVPYTHKSDEVLEVVLKSLRGSNS